MPIYMTQFTYSTKSIKGMVDSPQDRRAAAQRIFAAAGGSIIEMYLCFGEYDGVVIAEFPNDAAAASALMAVGSTGAFSTFKTTVLLTMHTGVQAMEGAKEIVGEYRPPSG
ncbi:GYD domain-containing protein [Roseovarius sp. EL26]|uniref:GYD domain-containing protein n=1 Tax=Roseovarius sp. EL26 TaxID=2126672 RepID=UPI000EA2448D|nr:GYD domain-containing protein [Roseovarius sp. EL26]